MSGYFKFPKDAPRQRVLAALKCLGFEVIRKAEHISLKRLNDDGTETPMTIPNHSRIKGSTLRTICTQARINRDAFLKAYYEA